VVGQKLFTISKEASNNIRVPVTDSGLTGLELAAKNNTNPWTMAEYNATIGPWYLIPNDILYLPSSSGSSSNEILPGVEEITATGLSQGKTLALIAKGSGAAAMAGNLNFTVTDISKEQEEQNATPPVVSAIAPTKNLAAPLTFFQQNDGSAEALQGVPRMSVPGAATLTLTTKDSDGHSYSIDQNLMIKAMDYGFDSPMQVSDNVIDPKVTEPEDAFVFNLVAPFTETKLWNGAFTPPTTTPTCLTDSYGRLRSFNNSTWIYFHSGFDYCGGDGDKIFAAADGMVIYTGELTVRGNATIIDHGHGLYTGYYHQSKIEVSKGQKVTAGQEIGLIGSTGRVTGPHLHLDVFVGGVQVDPTEWLNGTIP
jgi:murein DD-endopeptidase MepM/ murein hydrolase activator NlpD